MANLESGSNDTLATANSLVLSVPISGQLSSDTDKDVFKVTVANSTILNLAFVSPIQSSLSNYFTISVYDNVNATTPVYTTSTGASFDSFKFNAIPGDYFIQIAASDVYDSGQYSLNVTSGTFNGIVVENEINDTAPAANAVSLAEDVVGQTSAADDKDFYSLNLTQQGKYTFQFNAPTSSSIDNFYKISVLDGNGNVVSSVSTGKDIDFDFQATIAGTYYVSVESLDNLDTHQYDFKVTQFVNVLTGGGIDDYLLGTAGADLIKGLAGKDVLIGRDGDDTLDGGAGIDSMIGGTGNDTYVVDLAADQVVENPDSGTDTVIASFNVASLVKNVENLTLTGKAITGVGNTLDNYLTGNELNNSLNGSTGNDTLDGGAGNDTLIGGTGNDIFILDSVKDVVSEAVNGGTDTIFTKVDLATTAANVENINLMDGVVYVNGNASGNTITGNDGHNNINGLGGNDTIDGAAGADALNGGVGNDVLTGGSEADLFIFNTALSATTNVDTITDFEVGTDQIFLGRAVFSTLLIGDLPSDGFVTSSAMPVAADANDHILFNTTTGMLYYDKDGSGASAPIAFAHLDGGVTLTSEDFVVA